MKSKKSEPELKTNWESRESSKARNIVMSQDCEGQELEYREKYKEGDKEMHQKSKEVQGNQNLQELQRKGECSSVYAGSRMKTPGRERGGRANVKRISVVRRQAGI